VTEYTSSHRSDGFSWRPQKKTLALLDAIEDVLEEYPDQRMTVRQVYYRLVSKLLIPNNMRSYQNLVGLLTNARKSDAIPVDRFVDRARRVEKLGWGYASVAAWLSEESAMYRRRPTEGQEHYVEVWTEKDALSGVIENHVGDYGPIVAVSKGYPSYTLLYEAAQRFTRAISDRHYDHHKVHLIYLGDFDPSGENIYEVICSELWNIMSHEVITEKVALTAEQIEEHNLPPMPTKPSDSRQARFVAEHGDIAVELDALPPDALEAIVRGAVERFYDWDVRQRVDELERADRSRLAVLVHQESLLSSGDSEEEEEEED